MLSCSSAGIARRRIFSRKSGSNKWNKSIKVLGWGEKNKFVKEVRKSNSCIQNHIKEKRTRASLPSCWSNSLSSVQHHFVELSPSSRERASNAWRLNSKHASSWSGRTKKSMLLYVTQPVNTSRTRNNQSFYTPSENKVSLGLNVNNWYTVVPVTLAMVLRIGLWPKYVLATTDASVIPDKRVSCLLMKAC